MFDTGGEPMEMGEIADAVASTLGGCAVERAALGEGRADIYVGDDGAYRALLEQYGIESVPFTQQVTETAQFLANKQQFPSGAGVATGVQPC
jgi:hypothetical protein